MCRTFIKKTKSSRPSFLHLSRLLNIECTGPSAMVVMCVCVFKTFIHFHLTNYNTHSCAYCSIASYCGLSNNNNHVFRKVWQIIWINYSTRREKLRYHLFLQNNDTHFYKERLLEISRRRLRRIGRKSIREKRKDKNRRREEREIKDNEMKETDKKTKKRRKKSKKRRRREKKKETRRKKRKNKNRKEKQSTCKRRIKPALALASNQTSSQLSYDSGDESKVSASGTVHSHQLSQSVPAPRKLKWALPKSAVAVGNRTQYLGGVEEAQ